MSREARLKNGLLALADRPGLGPVLLRTPASFARNTAAVRVAPERERSQTANMEAPRTREEGTPGMEEHPRHEGPAKPLRALADGGASGAAEAASTEESFVLAGPGLEVICA